MRKAAVVLFMAMIALSFCSKKQEQTTLAERNFQEANEPRATRAAQGAVEAPLKVKSVTLSPETPAVADDIVAVAEADDAGMEGVSLEYQWFVNGRELDDVAGEKLETGRFKKGDWIYCQARASLGEQMSAWTKSDVIRALNTLPALLLGPVGDVRVPGEFLYRAAAGDADNDELKFELLSPLEQGIALDPQSGALSWKLTEDIVKALGEKVEIRIAVSDGEARVEGTITLNFTSTSNKTEQP